MAFAGGRNRTCQALGLALHIFFRQLGGPVGGKALAQQLFGAEAYHGTEGGVHIADAALQVACAQAGDEGVFHGLAKGQGIAQVTLCT